MGGLRFGQKIGEKLASPEAKARHRERSNKLDNWAARHRVFSTFVAAVLSAVAAWWLATKYDGATTGEIVLYASILIPIGCVGTWISLTRIRRRNT